MALARRQDRARSDAPKRPSPTQAGHCVRATGCGRASTLQVQQRAIPRPAVWLCLAVISSTLCACSGGAGLPSLPTVGALGELPKFDLTPAVLEPSSINASSAETYSRIARGAMRCWFGAQGRLKASHIFQADAAPSLNGGSVEIVIHERAVDQPKPWGYKAFRVTLIETTGIDGTAGGGGTQIGVDNLRMPDAEAAQMRAEVFQWATGAQTCSTIQPAAPLPPPPAAKTKAKAVAKSAKPAKASAPPAAVTTPPTSSPPPPAAN